MCAPNGRQTAGYARSRYFLLSPRLYRDEQGELVRVGYSTRAARMVLLDPVIAGHISTDRLDQIPAADLARLADYSAVCRTGTDELAEVVGQLQRTSAEPAFRQVVLMPTSYCNMACSYCGQEHFRSPVNEDRVRRVIARVRRTIEDDATRSIEIGWFGGEPLLAFRVVREMSAEFIAAADRLGRTYSARMTTNGSLLTPRVLRALHEECRLSRIEITIDGPEEVHNQRRLKKNGSGSFQRIVSVLADAVRSGGLGGLQIGIRVNIDNENEDSVTDLISDLACCGLAARQVQLHLVPVHSWGNDVSAVELAAAHYSRREFGWLEYAHAVGIDVVSVPNRTKRTTCITTSRYGELIDSDGRIYACTEHPLVPAEKDVRVIGTVDDLHRPRRPAGIFDDWYDRVAAGDQQCSRCPLLPVCGGRCPKLWTDGYVPCPSMKFGWEDRLDLAARQLGLTRVATEAAQADSPLALSQPR